ncbi:hypothetical protein MB818_05705 [Ruegeria sp. 1NDH52C]|uniref:Uncharacterized protein n=1 Tax=Ruegeria alba TaxID=2916756 RepID=A0ABS9NTY9_9RHOB|nr:hypothetical protein [Ruegeria alba]MCG6557684.1 hypothetical protein [Ruegeria alba]
MDGKHPSEMDYYERVREFTELFDYGNDPSVTLVALVRRAGDFLEKIVGPKAANEGMARIIGSLSANGPSAWRDDLENGETSAYSEWAIGEQLHFLSAYARYGIDLTAREHESAAEITNRLRAVIEAVEVLVDLCPLEQWLGEDRPRQLEETLLLAKNRWALDHGLPVEPEALAIFGGVTMGSMRNLLSGKTQIFTKIEGKIAANEALNWLADKRSFFPSIWESARREWDGEVHDLDYAQPVFVPQSRDGSVFHPGLKRGGAYTVGEKGNERQVDNFEEALSKLQEMRHPSWRRPGRGKGGWGIVSAIHWVRMTPAELDHLARVEMEGFDPAGPKIES